MLFRIIVGAVALVACFFLYKTYGYRFVLEDIRDTAPVGTVMGAEAAPINILAYLDYGSSWSRRSRPVLLQILSQNPDVNLIIKPFPGVSESSELAARIVLAGLEDNDFLDIHSLLMEAPNTLTVDYIKTALQLRGMNYDVLVERAYGDSVNEMITGIKREALLLAIDTTPQIYIENVEVPAGNITVADMETLIQDIRMGRR